MKTFNANTVIALAALLTSVTAVFVAWDESRLMRRSQAASFMPILETRTTLKTAPDDLTIVIEIRNTGHGVAYVEDAELLHDGQPVKTYADFSRLVLNETLGRSADLSWAGMRGFLQAGESKEAIVLRWDDTPENRAAMEQFIRHEVTRKQDEVELRLCYCSVFDTCWERSDLEGSKPVEVKSCTAGTDPSELLWNSYVALREAGAE